VTEKVRSIMDCDLGMEGACIPWLNKHDVEPLLINADAEYVQRGTVPGIRIFRGPNRTEPFDLFFCKTKYHVYTILMGLEPEAVEARMAERSRGDLNFLRRVNGAASGASESAAPDAATAPA
jgi:Lon-like ATP-dependent protease